LTRIAKEAEAQVPEQLKGQFLSIMVAGGKVMWSPELAEERQAFDQALQDANDVPKVVAHAVLKTIATIQNESGSDKPLDAMGLAAPIFMAHILQYVEAKHQIPVSKEMIDETGQLVGVNLMKMYGVTDEHVKELIRQRAKGQPAEQQSAEPAGQDEAEPGEPEEEA